MIISKKEAGRYKAFPTIVQTDKEFIIAYREGFVDDAKPHGRNGCVKFLKSADLENWQEFNLPFCDNELDSIISGMFNDKLFLATRSYEYKKRNDVYISRFAKDTIPDTRKLIKLDNAKITMFGHIIKKKDELFATAYGTYNGINSPIIVSSNDFGENWHMKSLITPNGFKPVLNETSISKFGDRFIAIMRSQEPSYDLYYSFSSDLISWSTPKETGLLGHAPMVKLLKNGKLSFVFRDLCDDLPGVAVALSSDGFKWKRVNIHHYNGNPYNGGYADFIDIGNDKLFVVYYTSDEDNEPWIEAQIVAL